MGEQADGSREHEQAAGKFGSQAELGVDGRGGAVFVPYLPRIVARLRGTQATRDRLTFGEDD